MDHKPRRFFDLDPEVRLIIAVDKVQPMQLSDLDFELPESQIAQQPAERRDTSRMLVVDRADSAFSDSIFNRLDTYLRADDLLVINNTRVFPARLAGRTDTGASVEIFLIERDVDGNWIALSRPARRLRSGKKIEFADGMSAEVLERLDGGKTRLSFDAGGDLFDRLESIGETPLPPYIKGPRDAGADRQRYQTIFAKNRGAVAAPTAGLHFTPDVFEALSKKGVTIAEITLHVGYGTFEPVRVDDLSKHTVAPERYEIDDATAELLNTVHKARRRIVAVGTTTTRALEANIAHHGQFVAGLHEADLTITPTYRFRAVGALLTNFHLPKSSLLILTSTFGGHELIMNAYRYAVAGGYRFYSYGDCMLVV